MTVTVARRVAPGREGDFENWAGELIAAGARFPGFLGAGLLRPGHVGGDWHVVYRFDNPAHLNAWEKSPDREALLAQGDELMRTIGVQRVTGLETWFELPGRTAPAPPRWKMFLVSGLGIWVLQVAVNVAFAPLVKSWPLAARLVVYTAVVTASMTWLVMPRLARALAAWLYAPPRGRGSG